MSKLSSALRVVPLVGVFAIMSPVMAVDVDANLPAYQSVEGIEGNLNSIGSDTLNELMTFMAEAFQELHPNVNVQIEGKGSSTAPPALIEGTAQLGPMSRAMKKEEIDQFERKFGYKPYEVTVAIDALSVFVHKDNPVTEMTLKDLDSIFSSTRRHGGKNDVTTWGQVGLTGTWATKSISMYGRNSASGTYGYFKEIALNKGDFKSNVKEQPGSSGVVQGVATDIGAIGYSGTGYITSDVHALSLGKTADKMFKPTYENCLNGDYPLARNLLIYINKKPGEPLDRLTSAFLRFVLSKEGQEIVAHKAHFYPLNAPQSAKVLADLDK
jgi:phosphate transport system substrate-binding protein